MILTFPGALGSEVVTYSCGTGSNGCKEVGALGITTKTCYCNTDNCDANAGAASVSASVLALLAAVASAFYALRA